MVFALETGTGDCGQVRRGADLQEIGAALCIAPTTVRTHLATIYRKLDVHTKAALINLAVDHRLFARTQVQNDGAALSEHHGNGAERFLERAGGLNKVAPVRQCIAVLPFDNMSGDPDQRYFSDGIAEDIVTELLRFHSFPVIACNFPLVYKGKSSNAQGIARELGVAYAVAGSVRRSGRRVRIAAQLIEVQTGYHLWAERYDRDLDNVFALQDEVVQRIVTNIAPRLHAEETKQATRRSPEEMCPHDHYLRAKTSYRYS